MKQPSSSHYICTTDSLGEYFRIQLEQHTEPQLMEDTRWYLGSMLDRFSRTHDTSCFDSGDRGLRPLAAYYGDAQAATSSTERNMILRHLGDLSLFLGALFPKYFERRGLKDSYVIGMGSAAYGYLAEVEQTQRPIFEELSSGFAEILQLISTLICQKIHYSADEMIRLYERWMTQGSRSDYQELQKLGLIADPGTLIN